MNEQEKKPSNPSLFPDPMRGAEQSYSNQTPWNLESGATLRDYFANSAMQGMISNTSLYDFTSLPAFQTLAKESYLIADAMLKAREF